MRSFILSVILAFPVLLGSSLYGSDTIFYELWDISNLDSIGGHKVSVSGDPQVVTTEIGDAVRFDGDGDRLLVDFNPVMDAKEFTVELVFNPDPCFPDHADPRFVHIQDPDDPDAKRVLIELRINEKNQCYMDGFIKTDSGSLALMDETLVHPTGIWHHVAITYGDSTLTTYFDGIKELSGTLPYSKAVVNPEGKTSLGARMNEVKHYSGLMKTLKVTHACLEPEDFIFIHDDIDTTVSRTGALKLEEGIKAYPNPVDKILNLKILTHKNRQSAEVNIFDISGKLFFSKRYENITGDILSMDTSGLQNGVYFISINSTDLTEYKRVVVNH